MKSRRSAGRRRIAIRRAVAVAAVAVVVGGLGAGPAIGDDGGQILFDTGDGQGFTHEPSAPLLNFDRLAPGYSTSGDVAVKNDSVETVALHLRATNIHDDENGCLVQETRDGDSSCGDGGGELARWLEIVISGTDDTGAQQVAWTGTVDQLADGEYLSRSMAAGAVWDLRMTATLLWEAGNDTMTDRLSYDLRWTMEGATGSDVSESPGSVAVGGEGPGAGTGTNAGGGLSGLIPGGGAVITLPMTGATIGLTTIILGLFLVGFGGLLVALVRMRRFGQQTAVPVVAASHYCVIGCPPEAH